MYNKKWLPGSPVTGNQQKLWRIVRLTIWIWLGCLMSVSASSYSQVTRLNMNFEDRSIREVMNYIESNSKFIFLYKDQDLDVSKHVSVHFKNARINDILDEMLENEDVVYSVYEKQIVLYKKPEYNEPLPSQNKILQPEKSDVGTGSIRGSIKDEKGLPMIGASVFIDKTTTGTVTDVNGNYQLLSVPAGKRNLRISFVGFQEEAREVTVLKGEVIVLNVRMKESSVEISGVVAYGQARGQLSAIQQQINAPGIANVVSGEKLQEMPDVNIAEAVGRLPGLMVERNRGEGQKIIIRGLQPKYNTISIGGNMVPSTSTDDRSTDLNMISPDILGGVEVLKANTADKDADGLGGTVNLILREAPSGLKMNASINSGYSGFSKSLSNYKADFYTSNRFFNDKLGVMLTGNVETAERNSDAFKVSYTVTGTPNYEIGETYIKPWVTDMSLQANIENRSRAGGSLLLDWKINPSSTIKLSNFIGYLNQHIYDRTKNYALTSNYINILQYQNIVKNILYSNSLEGKHFIFGSILNWGVSRSQSINREPYSNKLQFRKLSAFNGYTLGASFDVGPPELILNPENVNDVIGQYYFHNGSSQTYSAKETETGLFLNWQVPFKIGDFFSGYIKAGTKYKEKDRYKYNIQYHHRFDDAVSVNDFRKQYPDYTLTTEGNVGMLSIVNFLDQNYKEAGFLNNKYKYLKVNEVLNMKLVSKLYDDYLKKSYDFIPSGARDDYKTFESVFSYYLMSELKMGKYITFIPGIRYEKTDIEYKAYISEELPSGDDNPIEVEFGDTIASNSYHHFLPQIHLKIKPTEWFDIRLAYTNTLSRPDYSQLAPKKLVNVQNSWVKMGDTKLKPALSKNYDLILTFYKQKYGLLTLGAFYKDIKDFLWTRSALIISGTETDPSVFQLSRSTLGFTVTYPLNNRYRSTIKGLEIDIQSNLDFLPIKGFVCNMNLTLMKSETKYLESLVIRKLNPDYGKIPGVPRVIFVNRDTAYVDRLLSQPSYLANIGLGYDNQKLGLSVRLSFSYQDDILTNPQRRPDGADRAGIKEFTHWDFQFNQKITKRLILSGNIANIFNQPDRSVMLKTGYMTNLEYYGYLAQLGLKFNLY